MTASETASEKPSPDRRILVGEITGAHGIRGDVLVRSYTETPDAIAAYGPLTDASGKKSYSLRVVRVTSKGIVARVAGVEDRNGAEPLRGTKLYIERSKLPETGETEFYHADLIGLRAVAADGSALGKIVSVQNFGAGDLLELKPLEGETEFIPFEDRWVPSVDLNAGMLIINRPAVTVDDDSDEEDGSSAEDEADA
ncbi:ribosome maturation factor RimM [Hyphomicrobium sp. MC1]|uniref:ribosome maturation factor RimM n=1 Tax=Hyphomicrobium sp. (strain MC1) TaxID=717785 RepID=UPI000213EBAC|nr:ribosome maturation factor RimM [Hyphomicrobium sp. MC1]CCB67825.1 Ribosome maturation factor rimM [Hyphomicrobium sp. MC1]